MKKLLLIIAGIALLAVACRAEMNVLVDINEDRSGTASYEFGVDEKFREFFESTGISSDDMFGDLDFAVEGGVSTTRTEGDMTFTGVVYDFTDVDEAMKKLKGVTGSEDPLFEDFSFTMDDKTAELTAKVSAPEENLEDIPFDLSDFSDDVFSASFVLGLPGTVVEHNADEELADGRLRWELSILGGDKDIYAKSEFGSSSLWWLWVVLGVVLVVGVIAIIAAIVLGKQQSKQAVSDAGAQYPEPAVEPVIESVASPELERQETEESGEPDDEAPNAESSGNDAVDPSDEEDGPEQ